MKKLTLLIMCLMIGLGSYAVPAQMVARHIGQPDGSVLDVYLYGDEHFHFFMTTDSVPVFGTARGLCYADIRGEWLVVSDGLPTMHQNASIWKRRLSATRLLWQTGLERDTCSVWTRPTANVYNGRQVEELESRSNMLDRKGDL